MPASSLYFTNLRYPVNMVMTPQTTVAHAQNLCFFTVVSLLCLG